MRTADMPSSLFAGLNICVRCVMVLVIDRLVFPCTGFSKDNTGIYGRQQQHEFQSDGPSSHSGGGSGTIAVSASVLHSFHKGFMLLAVFLNWTKL